MKKRDLRIQAWIELALALALIILVNYLSSGFFTRIDFTKEKRYTLSDASKRLADSLDDVLYVKIYLDGDDMPAAYRNLRNATKEMLDEFRYASGSDIEYEISNPLEGLEGEELRNMLLSLRQGGIQVLDLYEKTNDGSRQKLIVPGAHFFYKGQQYPVHLVDPSMTVNNQSTINRAIEGLEFAIANTIRRCVNRSAKRVAFMQGHGELDEVETADARRLLEEFYIVESMNLNFDDSSYYIQFLDQLQNINPDSFGFVLDKLTKDKLNEYDAIVFAKPRIGFADREKYWIDQYVMHGGKVMWMIDPVLAETDSLGKYGKVYTADYDLNLNDLLFKYGARVNLNLVQDYNALIVPFARQGGGIDPRPWFYFPVVPSMNNHAINRNIDLTWLQFPASVDTVGSPLLKKTVLLQSSSLARISSHPAEINLSIARKDPGQDYFPNADVPLAVLIEGTFESPYAFVDRKDFDPQGTYRSSVEGGKMIVVGDGDLIHNYMKQDGQIYPAGYDRLTKKTFGNRMFFMNCMDYLVDDFGLIEVRNKDIQLRLLDKEKISKPAEQTKWKVINVVVPIVLILLFGVLNGFIRKRKYER
ncbi:MAG: gliding motility-associated ABC transporter substrate-binding protein GldG [Bacteroidetes bacterium]|nr:MAG: gliding motility-associated ABC transporter substrate-binding protein GldG [Bacteroidota bacterium]